MTLPGHPMRVLLVELRRVELLSRKFCQRYTTSLVRELSLALGPSTDGVAWRQPVGLRPPFPGARAAAPRFVSPGSHHPGIGEAGVAS